MSATDLVEVGVGGLAEGVITGDDVIRMHEALFEAGWTDGLPVIPPTRGRVDEFIRASGLPADFVVAVVPPLDKPATIEKIAANSVMAGCLPEYMPVVIASLRASVGPKLNLRGMQCSTQISTPLQIINGPIRKQLNFNCGAGVFGPGWRANATVGRALKLVLVNIGGAVPGEVDRATFAHPGKFTFCIAENEEESPWEPLHVEYGFKPEDSTVTVYASEAPQNILVSELHDNPTQPYALLDTIANMMSDVGSNQAYLGGEHIVGLSPDHAATIAQSGWKKLHVQKYLFEKARIPIRELKKAGIYGREVDKYHLWPRWIDRYNDDSLMPVARDASDIKIIVTGGPGLHSVYLPGLGSRCQIAKVELSS
jgi:hypothetical protein